MHYYGVRGIPQPKWKPVATISTLAAITAALSKTNLPTFFSSWQAVGYAYQTFRFSFVLIMIVYFKIYIYVAYWQKPTLPLSQYHRRNDA